MPRVKQTFIVLVLASLFFVSASLAEEAEEALTIQASFSGSVVKLIVTNTGKRKYSFSLARKLPAKLAIEFWGEEEILGRRVFPINSLTFNRDGFGKKDKVLEPTDTVSYSFELKDFSSSHKESATSWETYSKSGYFFCRFSFGRFASPMYGIVTFDEGKIRK